MRGLPGRSHAILQSPLTKSIEFLFAFFGIVEKLEPEKRIKAMTVHTHQSSRLRPEKTVGRVAFKINALAFGMGAWIPLVGIMA